GADHFAAYGEDRSKTDGWYAQQADGLVAVSKAYLARTGRPAANGADAARAREDDDTRGDEREGAVGGEDDARGTAPSGTGVADHYQVVVHVDEKALRGGAGRSDLPLPTIQRLTCDCSLIMLVEDEHGSPLALGRKTRNLTTALRRLLMARDRHCTFPGCM